ERIRRFSEIVFEAGISAPVRTPRGRDIDAACGQLKTTAEKKSRAELDRLAAEKQAALGRTSPGGASRRAVSPSMAVRQPWSWRRGSMASPRNCRRTGNDA